MRIGVLVLLVACGDGVSEPLRRSIGSLEIRKRCGFESEILPRQPVSFALAPMSIAGGLSPEAVALAVDRMEPAVLAQRIDDQGLTSGMMHDAPGCGNGRRQK